MSTDSDTTAPTACRSTQWVANSNKESRKLSNEESDWNLPGSALRSTRTRHGGHGRPNLNRRTSLSDSSMDGDDDDDDGEFEPEPESSDEDDSLTKMIYELSKCPECNDPIDIEIKTTCIVSHVKAACLNVDCGYILHSDPPAPTTIDEKSNDNYNRNTDYAVNVLYVLRMMCNGGGCSEATKILGLLGLPNDTTIEGRSFHIIEE